MTSSFKDRYGPWAFITGASKGLGLEFAHQCAARGLSVILAARSTKLLNEQAKRIKAEYGVEAATIPLDLSREEVLDIIRPVTDSLEIGMLINNAGLEKPGEFFSFTLEQQLTQLHLNARAALILSYHFGKLMAQRKRGGMIFLSSASALNGTPYAANYAGTKAYNLIMGESLWYELRKYGIDVLGFMPGITNTPGVDDMQPKLNRMVKVMEADETVAEALDNLGKHPSWMAGRENRLAYFILERLCSRTTAIRTVGKVMKGVFGPFQ
jgi:short-subunit dehydrogenase